MPPLYEKKAPDEDKEEGADHGRRTMKRRELTEELDAAASVGFCKYFQSLDPVRLHRARDGCELIENAGSKGHDPAV